MKPVFQTQFGHIGNCLQASIASVLELDIDNVPDIANIDEVGDIEWPLFFQRMMNELGFIVTVTSFRGESHEAIEISRLCSDTDGYFVTVGSNSTQTGMHSNVWNHNGMVHDPYAANGFRSGDCVSYYSIAYILTKIPQVDIVDGGFQLNLNMEQK